jgi:hypothetical protein
MKTNQIAILTVLAALAAGAASGQSDPYGPPGGSEQQGQYGQQDQGYGPGQYDDDWSESDNWYERQDDADGRYDSGDGYGHNSGEAYGHNGGYDDRYPAPSADVGFFYGALSPYGEWVRHPYYGWVWFPRNVHAGWRPYSIGRWVTSDYGWTWVSYERFGWATYHYGRWAWDRHVGWLWVPGTDWAPAWVAWQQGNGYIGWAPLPPAVGFDLRAGIQLGGFSLSLGIAPRNYAFVEERRFLDTRVGGYVVPAARNVTIIHNTTNITNYTVVDNRVINQGVAVDRIERVTGRRAQRMRIAGASAPGTTTVDRDVVSIYRPAESKLQSVKVAERNNAGLRRQARKANEPRKEAPPAPSSRPQSQKPRQGADVPIPVAPRVPPTPHKVNERQFTREQEDLKANQQKQQRSVEQTQRQENSAATKAKDEAPKVQQQHAAERAEQKVLHERTAEQLQTRQQLQRQAAKATADKELAEKAAADKVAAEKAKGKSAVAVEPPKSKKGGKGDKTQPGEPQGKGKPKQHDGDKPPTSF